MVDDEVPEAKARSLAGLVRLLDAELAASRPQDDHSPAAELDASEQLIRFAVGGMVFAVAADQMAEVDAVPALTFVPRVPSAIRGLANLRGEVIVVVDLARALALQGAGGDAQDRRMIVLRDSGRGRPGGVIVDRVFGITPFARDRIRAGVSDLPPAVAPFAIGTAAVDGQDMAVIDLHAVARSIRAVGGAADSATEASWPAG